MIMLKIDYDHNFWRKKLKACFTHFTATPILCFLSLLQLRRERIAERVRALQELVPGVNKVHIFLYYLVYYSGAVKFWLFSLGWKESDFSLFGQDLKYQGFKYRNIDKTGKL